VCSNIEDVSADESSYRLAGLPWGGGGEIMMNGEEDDPEGDLNPINYCLMSFSLSLALVW
jgi:hypothetical protein